MTAQIRIGVMGCGQIAQQRWATYAGIPQAEGVACLSSAKYRWDNVTETRKYYVGSQEHGLGALLCEVPLLPSAEIALDTMLISEGIYLCEALGREVSIDEIRQHSIAIGG